jgi:hypothetical protein
MSAPAWEELSVFTDPDDFGVLATFTRVGGQVIPDVPGIFDEAVMNVQAGEYDMAAGMPRFTCAHAPVASLKKNDAVTIDGVAYLLDHDPHPDGTGMAVLTLSRDFDV